MSNANRRAFDRGDIAVRNIAVSLVEVDPVVVSQFPLQHHIVMYAITEPSAYPEIVGAGLRDAEVVNKYASFDAALRQ